MVALCLSIYLKSNAPQIHRSFSFPPLKVHLNISALSHLIILFLLSLQIVSYPHHSFGSGPLWLSASGGNGKAPPKGEVPRFFLFSLSLPTHSVGQSTYSPQEDVVTPSTLPPSPRNTTQRHRGEPVPDPAACHHHKHHGQRSPQKHLLSQLQRPCRRQQIVGPCGPGCGDRWEPLRWRLQLHPAHLPFSKCDQYLGVTVNGHTRKLLLSRSPCAWISLGGRWLNLGFSEWKMV